MDRFALSHSVCQLYNHVISSIVIFDQYSYHIMALNLISQLRTQLSATIVPVRDFNYTMDPVHVYELMELYKELSMYLYF